jgi:Pentapeptide repeats (8 copies)
VAERQGPVPRTAGRARWVAAAVLGVGFVLWLVLFAPQLLVPAASLGDVPNAAKRHELQDSRLKLQNDVRTTLLQGLGGLAVVVGAFFTYRQVQTSRHQLEHTIESSRKQHELDRQGQVTERFTRAIDQLGHGNLDVRLGGIYALERIANDSLEDRATIAEVLTAYVRGHAPWPPSRYGQPPPDATIEDVSDLQVWAADVQAALTVLGRLQPPVGWAKPLNLSRTDLRRADLTNGHFEKASLGGSQLRKAYLINVQLQGAVLPEAQLQGALLIYAQLQGALLHHAQLQEAVLYGANLDGALLNDAQLQGALGDAKTVWPARFDWKAAGVELREN